MTLRELIGWAYAFVACFFLGGAIVEAATPPPACGIFIHTTWGEDENGDWYDMPDVGVNLDGKPAGSTDSFGYLLLHTTPGPHVVTTYDKWFKDASLRAVVTVHVKPWYWTPLELHFEPE